MIHLRGYVIGENLFGPLMGFKIQRRLGVKGVDDFKRLPIDVQADKDADLINSGKGFIQLVKAAGSEVSHEYIEKLDILKGSLEPVEQCGTWFISEKCKVVVHEKDLCQLTCKRKRA
jgi:hypothetical protein